MQLKKPCRICNIPNASFPSPAAHTRQIAQLRNFENRYELRLLLTDIPETTISVYLCSETIEVFQEDLQKIHDTLLLLLPIPINVNPQDIVVKRILNGICILMPKVAAVINTRRQLLSIEA